MKSTRGPRLRRGSNPHKIMKHLALGGGVLLISLVAPAGGALLVRDLLKGYLRRKSFERKRFLNYLKNLQARDMVDYRESQDGEVKITLTKQGERKVLAYQLDEMKLKKPQRWDKRWRLIMFDIPSGNKQARDAFRRKLRNLEFYPLQKSVYLTPYPCENEIDFLASIFNVRRHILVLYVDHFEGEEKLKHHFSL